jgi:hypothetical protein
MNSSPTSGSATRQLAHRQGLARMSAITRGIGAVSILGAITIAIALPQSTAASTVKTATAATTRAKSSSSRAGSSTSQIQTTPAPATTTNPPPATSGGS